MSFKSLYSIKKETDVTQGITPLKCETSLGHSETFRNVCKAPSVGDAALCWCWFKACAQDPTSPRPGQCLLVMHHCQEVLTCLFIGPRMTTWAAENWPLSLCAWAWHQSRRRSTPLQLFCYAPVRQSQLDVPNIFPGSALDFLQPPVTGVRSRQ